MIEGINGLKIWSPRGLNLATRSIAAGGLAVALVWGSPVAAEGRKGLINALPSVSQEGGGKELGAHVFHTGKGQVRTSLQCLGGYLFAVAAAVGHSAAPQSSTAIIQVYQEHDGASVPATCENGGT